MARILRRVAGRIEAAKAALRGGRPIAIFHQYHRPPYGGGNQFLLALRQAFRASGLPVVNNIVTARTVACIFNSFNFDFDDLRRQRRPGCRMVHRVDGPIGRYRGTDPTVDQRLHALNLELADATVFQSWYSLNAHAALGMQFRNPVVIGNAVDGSIFYPTGRIAFDRNRPVRLVATSWSDNPGKGGAVYRWLDEHLDWSRYSFTFVGRTQERFTNIRHVPAVPSHEVADILRAHDVYITASRNDPCSNALLEALACGLPALYANDGGHPELVGDAGLPFDAPEEIPSQLERLVGSHEAYQSRIRVASIADVARSYLQVCGVEPGSVRG